jgi:hypothetical protein
MPIRVRDSGFQTERQRDGRAPLTTTILVNYRRTSIDVLAEFVARHTTTSAVDGSG